MSAKMLLGVCCALVAFWALGGLAVSAELQAPAEGNNENRGDVLTRLDEARSLLGERPEDASARYDYAGLLLELGRFEDAREEVKPLLDRPDTTLDAVVMAARLSYFLGDFAESERLFREVLEQDPSHQAALRGLVFNCYQTNQFDRCGEIPEEARAGLRFPLVDLMLAFGEEAPYVIEWTGEHVAEVPFLVTNPLPVIEVEINGRKVNALIDTGADVFILDTAIADELGLRPVASMMGMFAGGMQAEIGFARAEALRLGVVTLRSVPVSLLPTNHLSMGDTEIGGIVGTSVLRQFLSTVDYPNARLVLRDRSADAGPDLLSAPGVVLSDESPFYIQGTHFILTHGSLNGYKGLLFHVDSGLAGIPSFGAPRQTLDYVGIPIPEVEVREGVVGGGGGGFAVGEFPIGSLGLGRLERHQLVGSYGGQPPGSYRGLGFIVDGLVSHNFLKEYAWTLDFDNMMMYFTSGGPGAGR